MSRPLSEGLHYKDLMGMMKPTIHVDEFSSKMGDDDEIIVASFFVRDRQAAKDLINWFEKGYDWILDADMSPGEIKPNRYLVYVEMKRRSKVGEKINEMLNDLNTLTEYEDSERWTMHYRGKDTPWSVETFNSQVPISPAEYRKRMDGELNEMRAASGLPVKQIYKREKDIQALQSAAGLI
jgi:hypothetical protein